MHWDVIFLHINNPEYFDNHTLETKATGGTEASIVRVAEVLGSMGLKVGVVQNSETPFKKKKGEHCYYLHIDELPASTTCEHFVQIRIPMNAELFPKAKKYLWVHDIAREYMADWEDILLEYKIKLVCVSDFHAKAHQKFFKKYKNITYIYNPISEKAYIDIRKRPLPDKNLMIWMSNPSRGLDKALELHQKIRKQRPTINFKIF